MVPGSAIKYFMKKPLDSADVLHPFLIDHSHIRGQMVRLGPVVDEIITRHNYPAPVSRLLGEMLIVGALLSSNLTAQGILTLQAKGDGLVKFIVVDATHEGKLRGYAQLADDALPTLKKMRSKRPTLAALMGKGYLAITLDQAEGSRYQGIVELARTTIADALQNYFTQSQQVEMSVRLAVDRAGKNKRWVAGGIMIERLPEEGGVFASVEAEKRFRQDAETAQAQWQEVRMFMETVTSAELLDAELSTWDVLRRLFNEDGVWAYPPRPLSAECRCSRERVSQVIATIPKEELTDMFVKDTLSITCQFCNTPQLFSREEVHTPHEG